MRPHCEHAQATGWVFISGSLLLKVCFEILTIGTSEPELLRSYSRHKHSQGFNTPNAMQKSVKQTPNNTGAGGDEP